MPNNFVSEKKISARSNSDGYITNNDSANGANCNQNFANAELPKSINTSFNLQKIKLFLLDLDGTLYLGSEPIDGAFETVTALRNIGKKVCFLTNNSSRSTTQYLDKLNGMGLTVSERELISSTKATMFYLKKYHADKSIFLVATPAVRTEFEQNGFIIKDSAADIVVLTFDTTIDYSTITTCCNLLMEGAFYVATHPDMVCPYIPHNLCDIGSFMLMIEGATGRKPDIICGKPHHAMAEYVTELFRLENSEIAMVGDRLYTDIRFGIDNDFSSVLVLSGETTQKMLEESALQPTLVLPSFRHILD